jgi:A/G-specific adenine glycosylase
VAARLLAWFDVNRRDLPWRRTRDPYRVWVAEIMLQQTQVPTAIPYYRRFVRAFPTVRRLAAAPLDEVLRLWSGLGYYSRARNLHAAARLVVSRDGGRIPRTYEGLLALPGVGAYTAGALLSIVFGQRLPALDGNAARVLARVFRVRGDIRSGRPRRRLEAVARAAVPEERPGDHNQALMDLGSSVCVPQQPFCDRCPLAIICEARLRGEQDAIPAARRRPRPRSVRMVAAVGRRRGRVLIVQRPEGGVWGGLWEFPNEELTPGQEPVAAARRFLRARFALHVTAATEMPSLRYGIVNQRVELSVSVCEVAPGPTKPGPGVRTRWVRPRELDGHAMPAPHRRIARALATRPTKGPESRRRAPFRYAPPSASRSTPSAKRANRK